LAKWLALHHILFTVYQTTNMIEITMRKRPRVDAATTQRKFFKKTARGKVIKSEHVIAFY
jgi:hypothetical protein